MKKIWQKKGKDITSSLQNKGYNMKRNKKHGKEEEKKMQEEKHKGKEKNMPKENMIIREDNM